MTHIWVYLEQGRRGTFPDTIRPGWIWPDQQTNPSMDWQYDGTVEWRWELGRAYMEEAGHWEWVLRPLSRYGAYIPILCFLTTKTWTAPALSQLTGATCQLSSPTGSRLTAASTWRWRSSEYTGCLVSELLSIFLSLWRARSVTVFMATCLVKPMWAFVTEIEMQRKSRGRVSPVCQHLHHDDKNWDGQEMWWFTRGIKNGNWFFFGK